MTEAGLVRALLAARDRRRSTPPPTRQVAGLDLEGAYRVGAALDRRLRGRGYRRAGWKVGFTNKTIWPRFGLTEPILGPVYEQTLRMAAPDGMDGMDAPDAPVAELSLAGFFSPRIEVEVVFGIEAKGGAPDWDRPDWMALGFEVVDCHYGWELTPADSVADFALHGALVVGPRVHRAAPGFAEAVEHLDQLEVRLSRNDEPVAEGRGSAVLGHPRAALGFVPRLRSNFENPPHSPSERVVSAGTMTAERVVSAGTMTAERVVSTGTMTALAPLSPGERWRVEARGVGLPGLELAVTD